MAGGGCVFPSGGSVFASVADVLSCVRSVFPSVGDVLSCVTYVLRPAGCVFVAVTDVMSGVGHVLPSVGCVYASVRFVFVPVGNVLPGVSGILLGVGNVLYVSLTYWVATCLNLPITTAGKKMRKITVLKEVSSLLQQTRTRF